MSVEIRGGSLLVEVDGVLNVLPLRGVPAWRKLLGLESDVDAVAAMLTAQDDGTVDGYGNTAWALAWQALREEALAEVGVEAPDPDAVGILPQDVREKDGCGQSPVDEFIHGPKWSEQVAQLEAAATEMRAATLAQVDEVELKRQQARAMLGLEAPQAVTRAATVPADPGRVPVFGTAAREALAAEGVEPLESAAPMQATVRPATLSAATVAPSLPLPGGVDLAGIQAALTEAVELIEAAEQEFDRHLLAGIWERVKGEPEPGPRTETEGVTNES